MRALQLVGILMPSVAFAAIVYAATPTAVAEGFVSVPRAATEQRSAHWLVKGEDLFAIWAKKQPTAPERLLAAGREVPVSLEARSVARDGRLVETRTSGIQQLQLPEGGTGDDFPEFGVATGDNTGWFAYYRDSGGTFVGFRGIQITPYHESEPMGDGKRLELSRDVANRASYPSYVQAGPPPKEQDALLKWNRGLLMNLNGWDFAGGTNSLALALQYPGNPDRVGAAISDDGGRFWRGEALGVGYNPGCALLPDRLLVAASQWRQSPESEAPQDGVPDTARDQRLESIGNRWGRAGALLLWRLPRKLDTVPAPTTLVEHGVLSSRMATDGKERVFLVMVRPAPSNKSSLWLMTSKDGGATWDQPEKLTDGKSVDWEPSVIFYHGSVWIAYSHSEAGRLASNIRYVRVKIDPDTAPAKK